MGHAPKPKVSDHLSSTLCHLGNIAYRTGSTLQFDAKTERFIDGDSANTLAERSVYRKPYTLPKMV